MNTKIDRLCRLERANHTQATSTQEALHTAYHEAMTDDDLDQLIEAQETKIGAVAFDVKDTDALQMEVERLSRGLVEQGQTLPPMPPTRTHSDFIAFILSDPANAHYEKIWMHRIRTDQDVYSRAKAEVLRAGLPWPF
ncbi:MAG: hypothetical protein EOM20_11740 [Spartobacteria bacterium]|nr:hypothetical protein [Spartobacteria bacterium]